ncbi:helix-turn-helix domain-containing protein [Eggerthella sp. NSJ-70]|uniref:Helix-turn-helix domain-containing protein n=1 Tax=Eggerthella hominis TaxID=2763043 RepID=A0ABR7BRH4_9ACTN|nr:PucR family transcriptional regulator [Eggerthella hominis]MBC5584210.1 helix-turn-helix domain-containing protein [Eggerthella hominis]
MITVADILALPAFEQVQPITQCVGAGAREVRNVGILDCAPDKDDGYASYIPGEFIVTNLGFARDDPELSERSLLVLIARGVSGIALKKVYRPIVSECVVAAAEEAGVPLYLYDGGYHEVVAYQALDLIRRDAEESDKGRILDELLSGHDPQATRGALYELAGTTGSTVQCVAAAPRALDECSLYATLDALSAVLADFKRDWEVVDATFVFRYHGALLAFVSYAQPPAGVRSRSEGDLVARMRTAGSVSLGVGEETPLSDGDMSVREALAALKTAQIENEDVVTWADLHHDAFRAAACEGRLFWRTAALHRALLEEYDDAHGTELAATAEAVARAYGDLRLAAEALHQHPNTVRYRLRKAKDVLGMSDSPDREFTFLLGLVYLDHTNPLLQP